MNYELRTKNSHGVSLGFTLVEILIVVAILGILAAIVLPEFQGHIQRAKEAAAKDSLRILRETIERYAAEHNGVPPGYQNNNITLNPLYLHFKIQLTSVPGYIPKIPTNPFNDKLDVMVLGNSAAFPAGPLMTNNYGWIYKPSTKVIKLNWAGTDSDGKGYFEY